MTILEFCHAQILKANDNNSTLMSAVFKLLTSTISLSFHRFFIPEYIHNFSILLDLHYDELQMVFNS